jgi:hypothetical protein
MVTMTIDLDAIRKSDEARAKAILHFINTVCLPEGAASMDDMEALSREVDDAIARIKHDMNRMENLQ